MKRYEFTGTNELTEKAFYVYSNSDFAFYKDNAGTFWKADNQNADPDAEIGTLEDVIDFLEQFAE